MILRTDSPLQRFLPAFAALAATAFLVTSILYDQTVTAAAPVETLTDAERDRLVSVLKEKRCRRPPQRLAEDARRRLHPHAEQHRWDLHFARNIKTDEGRQVVIATDRPMSFWEAANRPRSADLI